ncbi:MAG: hypothetical protein AAGA48_17235 [Myxococcota bacterium]
MSRTSLNRSDAEVLLHTLIRREVARAASGNRWVSRKEQRGLPAALDAMAEQLRREAGPGSRLRADDLVERAAQELTTAFGTQANTIRAWFESFDFVNRRFSEESLPEGKRVDARSGQPGRRRVPTPVREAFDYYYRAERADIASVSLHRGRLAGRDLWAVYVSNDGNQQALEVLDPSGATLEGATLLEGELLGWDTFPRQVRLAAWLLALDPPAFEDGLSEPDERAAAGQVPLDWTDAEGMVEIGTLRGVSDLLVVMELSGPLSSGNRERVYAAFSYLWSVHLTHRAEKGVTPLQGNGVLRYGTFRRPTTGVTYWVADWRDIDDGSYVLYFSGEASRPVLSIVQFDN